MTISGRAAHWQNVYESKGEREVSWFQESPSPSLELIALADAEPTSPIVDIGGGAASDGVDWIVADVTTWQPTRNYDIWHDRAAFHFLNAPKEQAAYVACVRRAVQIGGHVIIGTFAIDGPEKCSGLPVTRHTADSITALLGAGFTLTDHRRHKHATPWQSVQNFQFSSFIRSC
jgi:hypothetical protein